MQGIILTASPEFVAAAMEELRELTPTGAELTFLGEGVFFWQTADPQAMAELIRVNQPVFLHHLHVAASWPYAGREALVSEVLRRLPDDLSSISAGSAVATQGRLVNTDQDWQPRELKQAIDPMLVQQGFLPAIKDPEWIISVTLAKDSIYYGVALAKNNLSDWTGGMIHFRKEPGDISRSKFKLLEAVIRWQLALPAGGRALDLGAAPGGWTSVLLEHGLRVVAVDTGELDPRLELEPRLTFRQQNVKDLRLPGEAVFDLITCDMSWDPFFTVRTINGLIEQLVLGGQVILTVKLMGKQPRQTIRQVLQRLDGRLLVLHAQHLFHNREEITLHLQRRA